MAAQNQAVPRVRLKAVAFPPEHGAWGFLLEPILLGLLIAPTLAGVFLALAVLGAFLLRHPLKIVIADRRRGQRYDRTAAAEKFVGGYGALAAIGLAAAVLLADADMLLPVLFAAPLGLLQLAGYTSNRGREVLPELAGASAIAVAASCIVLAGGESLEMALVLWLILLARDIPSILYVRARLRLEKGKDYSARLVYVANGTAVAGVLALAAAGLAPLLTAVAVIILAARAAYGLSRFRRPVRAPVIGILEMVYGILVVVFTAVGYSL